VPKRFRHAPRAVLTIEGRAVEVVVAERFGLRLLGLAGLGPRDLRPLLFPRCRSLHTFGMRAAIDIVWLELSNEGEGAVLDVDPDAGPRRGFRAPRGAARARTSALELRSGDAGTLGLKPGSRVRLQP
jgi:uncharacterized membrane protein (UPF0127 family)